ncbi:MAG: hypothetical protein L0219_17975 [Phycisphaerales bacterium]|nr:hypothetical protein [Phycisphaerales bacterium]
MPKTINPHRGRHGFDLYIPAGVAISLDIIESHPTGLRGSSFNVDPCPTPPRHRDVDNRAGENQKAKLDQAPLHGGATPFVGSGLPHSVQASLAPIGYAHAGHNPRLMRLRRRTKPGAAKSSQRIAA